VHWQLNDKSILKLLANLGDQSVEIEVDYVGELLFSNAPDAMESIKQGKLNSWTVVFLFEKSHVVPAI